MFPKSTQKLLGRSTAPMSFPRPTFERPAMSLYGFFQEEARVEVEENPNIIISLTLGS